MNSPAALANLFMLKEVEAGSIAKNIVISPVSLNAILSMIAAGATGDTLDELLKFLGFDSKRDRNESFSSVMAKASSSAVNQKDDKMSGPILNLLNGLWVDKRFQIKPSFEQISSLVYQTKPKEVDFVNKADEVIEEANSWAKKATKGHIKNIMSSDSVSPSTIALLGTAIYFKARWAKRFGKTEESNFYLLDGSKVRVPFMKERPCQLYGSFEDYQVVSIPYRTGGDDTKRFSMYFFLPNESDGLLSFLQHVHSNPSFFTRDFKLKEERIDVFWIPKFNFSYKTKEAVKILKEMGITRPFYISNITHWAYIEVDEEGTEAVAVTFTDNLMGCCLNEREPIIFVADHPFVFMIREENSGLVLFVGAVLDPSLSEIVCRVIDSYEEYYPH